MLFYYGMLTLFSRVIGAHGPSKHMLRVKEIKASALTNCPRQLHACLNILNYEYIDGRNVDNRILIGIFTLTFQF